MRGFPREQNQRSSVAPRAGRGGRRGRPDSPAWTPLSPPRCAPCTHGSAPPRGRGLRGAQFSRESGAGGLSAPTVTPPPSRSLLARDMAGSESSAARHAWAPRLRAPPRHPPASAAACGLRPAARQRSGALPPGRKAGASELARPVSTRDLETSGGRADARQTLPPSGRPGTAQPRECPMRSRGPRGRARPRRVCRAVD